MMPCCYYWNQPFVGCAMPENCGCYCDPECCTKCHIVVVYSGQCGWFTTKNDF